MICSLFRSGGGPITIVPGRGKVVAIDFATQIQQLEAGVREHNNLEQGGMYSLIFFKAKKEKILKLKKIFSLCQCKK